MRTGNVTTPFGRRSMSLGMIATQIEADDIRPDAAVHKWHVFQNVKEARPLLGATDRALAILDALLSFHPETAFYADTALIVWPSNEQLIHRANGMSPATLRRHLGNLVDCGLIIRRDSPNGKRFARKGEGGQVEHAYGFDLTPLVVRADEIKTLAERVRAERRATKLAKERLTIVRREIVKLIELGIDEGVPGHWGSVQLAYQAIIVRLPRSGSLDQMLEITQELDELRSEIREVLESFVKSQKLNANESQFEHHIQNSNPDSKTESESGLGEKAEASGSAEDKTNLHSLPHRELPLNTVLDACENLRWLVKGGGEIRNWREFLSVTEKARPLLGISPSAWADAVAAMGEKPAGITLAAIYQRQDKIRSPGGYLRDLTEKAKLGKFSVFPVIMALLRARLDEAKEKSSDTASSAAAKIEVSSSLREFLGQKS